LFHRNIKQLTNTPIRGTQVLTNSRFARWFALCLSIAVGGETGALAIDIQGTLPASADQPTINALLQPVGGGNPYMLDLLGFQTFNISAFLDTGTSGVVISGDTADLWGVPLSNGVTFSDVAIGGATDYNVTQPLNIRLAPSNSLEVDNLATYQTVYNQTVNNVQIQAGPFNPPPDPNALSLDVFGMPVLTGKTMVSDVRGINNDTDFLRTYIYNPGTPFNPGTADTNPGIPQTNHHVAMSYGDFSRFTQTSPSGAAGPVFTHNPFIGPDPLAQINSASATATPALGGPAPPPVSIGFQGHNTSGSFLFDTGAQVSFISTKLAGDLQVRYRDGTFGTDHPVLETFDGTALPGQFFIPVQGISGTVTVAGFVLDSLILHAIEGGPVDSNPNNLHYAGAPVFVLDLTVQDPTTLQSITLDGDLGMNFLFGSQAISGGQPTGPVIHSPYDWVTFDEPSGILGLNVVLVPEPGTMGLATTAALLLTAYAWRRRGLRAPARR
jgi:hypothetical protein